MARFVFITWNGGGNQPPAIGVAQELAMRGHEVTFAGYASQRARFEELGFTFRLLEQAQAAWREEPPARRMAALVDAVMACPEHLTELPGLLARERCDVLVVDCLMFGALTAAETVGLPMAVLVHSAPGALAAPGGGMERLLLGPVNQVRAVAGRPAVGRLWDAWAPFPTLCTSIPQLDPLAALVPPSFSFVGPVLERLASSTWHSPWPIGDPGPLVLVSFSTGKAWDQASRIRRTLDALAGDRYRVLVATGMADLAELAVPNNAVLLPYVPHAAVLGEVAVTVTHAGHGTVAASLAHGVPLVSLPNLAADQPALATRVAALGAGRVLDGESAGPGDIADAVDTVVGDPSYAAAARRLAKAIAATSGPAGTASRIEGLARHSRLLT